MWPPRLLPPRRHISHASRHVGIVLLIRGVLLPSELATGGWLCRCPYCYRGRYPLEDILAMLAANVGKVLLIPGVLLPRELATNSWLCRFAYRHHGRYPLEEILAMEAAM